MLSCVCSLLTILTICVVFSSKINGSNAQLEPFFYSTTCPNVSNIVRSVLQKALLYDPRIGASLIRLHFHDCFVNSGGPTWTVPVGRRDSLIANLSEANRAIPPPSDSLSLLTSKFAAVPIRLEMHSVMYSSRVSTILVALEKPDPTLDSAYLKILRQKCPRKNNGFPSANLDVKTNFTFDNKYFSNLLHGQGLLRSDQELFSTPNATTIPVVNIFSRDQTAFFEVFVHSMIKMGNISPVTGKNGEVRKNCRKVNDR